MCLRSLTSEGRGGEGRVCVCVSGLSLVRGGEVRGGFVCVSQVSH